MFALLTIPGNGQTIPDAFADTGQVGINAIILHCEHLASPTHAGLNFVRYKNNPMFVAKRTQMDQEAGCCDVMAAFSLHRFKENRGNLVRQTIASEQRLEGALCVFVAEAVEFIGKRQSANFARKRSNPDFERYQ